MREVRGLEGVLFVGGEGADWRVYFRDGTEVFIGRDHPGNFPTEDDAVYWAKWALDELYRLADD